MFPAIGHVLSTEERAYQTGKRNAQQPTPQAQGQGVGPLLNKLWQDTCLEHGQPLAIPKGACCEAGAQAPPPLVLTHELVLRSLDIPAYKPGLSKHRVGTRLASLRLVFRVLLVVLDARHCKQLFSLKPASIIFGG